MRPPRALRWRTAFAAPLALVAVVAAHPGHAMDVGVATLIGTDRALHLQVDVFPMVRVDVAAQHESFSSGRTQMLGVGAFHIFWPTDSVAMYYGGRASWGRSRRSITRPASDDPFGPPTTEKHTASGFSVGPAIGMEYFLGSSMSVGVEARWTHSTIRFDDHPTRSRRTSTGVMLRYYFGGGPFGY
jgi:hypothetical protein